MPTGEATPVQVVKMLFLIEEEAKDGIGGAKFHFVPYDYGPFDQGVYVELNDLARQGLVEIIESRPRVYRLTELGRAEAAKAMARLDEKFSGLIYKFGKWMSGLTFAQLVTAIYDRYPKMRANSIFRG